MDVVIDEWVEDQVEKEVVEEGEYVDWIGSVGD